MRYSPYHAIGVVLIWIVLSISGVHPIGIVPITIGVFLPNIDTFREKYHRSWLTHTYLAPALLFIVVDQANVANSLPIVVIWINLASIGLSVHFFCDYIYPKTQTHPGSEWPVRPSIGSTPWGLIWLGVSWSIQWFGYLAVEFIPWIGRMLIFN